MVYTVIHNRMDDHLVLEIYRIHNNFICFKNILERKSSYHLLGLEKRKRYTQYTFTQVTKGILFNSHQGTQNIQSTQDTHSTPGTGYS